MIWCVRHRDGWCATATGRRCTDGAWNVGTKCKHFIVAPTGCEVRKPTCPECLAALKKTKRKASNV